MKAWLHLLAGGAAVLASLGPAPAADQAVDFHEGKLRVALPPGWKPSQQDTEGSDVVAGWESSDRKTSFYVLPMPLASQADDMRRALEATVDNFDRDENWLVGRIGEYRDITLNGLPAAYVRVELELAAEGRKTPFVFHLAVVGGANHFYLLQASTMKPVWQPREDELIRMMKSFQILSEG